MNLHSSRSHAIFIVTVECAEVRALGEGCGIHVIIGLPCSCYCISQRGPDGEDHVRVGKLNLVDLAGSERQAKTQSSVRLVHIGTMEGREGGSRE